MKFGTSEFGFFVLELGWDENAAFDLAYCSDFICGDNEEDEAL